MKLINPSDNSRRYLYSFNVLWRYEIIRRNKSEDYSWIIRVNSVRLRIDGKTYSISFPDTTTCEKVGVGRVMLYHERQSLEKELIEKLANAKSYIDVEFYGVALAQGDVRKLFALKRSDIAQLKMTCQNLLDDHRKYINGK